MTLITGDELAALDALNDLVHSARGSALRCEADGMLGTMQAFTAIARDLDRVRTRLVQEHAEYLEQAWREIDAHRWEIARHRTRLYRRTP